MHGNLSVGHRLSWFAVNGLDRRSRLDCRARCSAVLQDAHDLRFPISPDELQSDCARLVDIIKLSKISFVEHCSVRVAARLQPCHDRSPKQPVLISVGQHGKTNTVQRLSIGNATVAQWCCMVNACLFGGATALGEAGCNGGPNRGHVSWLEAGALKPDLGRHDNGRRILCTDTSGISRCSHAQSRRQKRRCQPPQSQTRTAVPLALTISIEPFWPSTS